MSGAAYDNHSSPIVSRAGINILYRNPLHPLEDTRAKSKSALGGLIHQRQDCIELKQSVPCFKERLLLLVLEELVGCRPTVPLDVCSSHPWIQGLPRRGRLSPA